ncbi:hypothetical protein OK074_4793 [Actinobacteria bacterium OK074]|nr:hypothetical protein OK074_4793 [Actinobacteria bacterium OK074]
MRRRRLRPLLEPPPRAGDRRRVCTGADKQKTRRRRDLSEAEGHLVLFESDFLDPAAVVAARLETPGSPAQYDVVDTFHRFREAVERDFTKTREVADYARNLGYSPAHAHEGNRIRGRY